MSQVNQPLIFSEQPEDNRWAFFKRGQECYPYIRSPPSAAPRPILTPNGLTSSKREEGHQLAPTCSLHHVSQDIYVEGLLATMSRSHVSNTTLSLGSTGTPATPQGKKMGKQLRLNDRARANSNPCQTERRYRAGN